MENVQCNAFEKLYWLVLNLIFKLMNNVQKNTAMFKFDSLRFLDVFAQQSNFNVFNVFLHGFLQWAL